MRTSVSIGWWSCSSTGPTWPSYGTRRGRPQTTSAGAEQVDHEHQGLVGLDHASSTLGAVAEVRRNGEAAATAEPHPRHALVPAADHLTGTETELDESLRSQLASNCLPVLHDTPT